MMAFAAQALVILVGVWLAGLGVWMFARPDRALQALAAMGSGPIIHFGEMILRTGAGIALILAAEVSRYPMALGIIGIFLIVSAVILMILPRRWHAAYSTWWAGRIPVLAVRLIGPVSVLGGGLLIWTMMPA